jgi:hypothetical protein
MKKLIYLGRNLEIVYVLDIHQTNGDYLLIEAENGLQWYAARDKLVESTPLLEALL